MFSKLIDASFDPKTGISVAKIKTELGIFEGKAKLHEEDKDLVSSFAGCRYAETKAIIKYMKKRIVILNYQIKVLKDLKKRDEKESIIDVRIKELIRAKEQWQLRINALKENIETDSFKRKEILKKVYNKRSGK